MSRQPSDMDERQLVTHLAGEAAEVGAPAHPVPIQSCTGITPIEAPLFALDYLFREKSRLGSV